MIIITVPHSFCLEHEKERHCDLLAKKSALNLINLFNDNNINYKIFLPSTLRKECDLNRDICKNTNYRIELREFIKKNFNLIKFTFDIHSFPNTESKWNLYQLIILDDFGYENNKKNQFSDYGNSLYKYCSKKGIAVVIWNGQKNSIQDEIRKLKLKNLLLEFNESNNDFTLNLISKTIIEWLKLNNFY